jgi:hypothetical protein
VKAKKKIWFVLGLAVFAVYFFIAARPIPLETVLVPRWLASLESGTPIPLGDSRLDDIARYSGENRRDRNSLMPFELGSHFGYFDHDGNFSVNQTKNGNISLSPGRWAEYDAEPTEIAIHGSDGQTLAIIENPQGYPFFLDGRTFLIGSEQNALSEIDDSGAVLWTYEFASPLTCVDAAASLVLVGSLDGIVGVLDKSGRQIFSFEPGGSRYSIILGCAISRDGTKLAVISGIDDQRFLLLERFGTSASDYKVVYHEFQESDFRRPVYISFIEDDRWIVFERSSGLGFFEIGSRQTGNVTLNGGLSAIDHTGGQGLVFAVISRPGDVQELVGIRLPGRILINAPFKGDEVFLGRSQSRLFIGGKQTLVSFDIEKR